MKGCNRIGIELSWRCNWNCKTCFYHHDERLHSNIDADFEIIKQIIDRGVSGGCTHAVVVGWGEPSLSPMVYEAIEYCNYKGISSSVITNGATGVERFKKMFDLGLDHLHVSTHGIGNVLDEISGQKHAYEKQMELLKWLHENKKPWRSNITLQKSNYKQLRKITEQNIEYSCFHQVYLNFLPHYHWNEPSRLRKVAVHPAKLNEELEPAIEAAEKAKKYITVRYFPFCHLKKKNWKYIVNAYYVAYDPWEWVYNDAYPNTGEDKIRQSAESLAGIGYNQEPCISCKARVHCGGFNKFYINGFDDKAGIRKIETCKPEENKIGFFHDKNPVNHLSGDTKGVKL